ncbi:MATE family efflux transporter [Oceanivirga salmonicida]|uniref:MATE family efflux transporter n=1 Tax=Oceanivirga salmonicida TaxID=1769291 RepID=UPI000835ED75|nr:MATE family efflux transporter [Oceanivirga salmonicida]
MTNKNIYKKILWLAIPITLENLIYSFINFVDIFMVGREDKVIGLGADAVSALGVSNQFFFLFLTSLFGLLSGASILSSQYYGAKDFKNLRKITVLFVLFSLIYVIPFFVLGKFFPNLVLGFYTNNKPVMELGYRYLGITIWTFPLTALGMAFGILLRSVNLPKYSLYTSILGLCINIVLNTTLIPVYGVSGAATATLISRLVTVTILPMILIIKKVPVIPKLKDILDIDFGFIKKVLSLSFFTFLHEILWSMAVSVKTSFFGRMGTTAFSSIQIAASINSLLFTVFIGLTAATAVIVGNELGNDNPESAYEYSKKIVKIYTVVLFLIIIVLNIITPFVLRFMGVSPEVFKLTRSIIYMVSITSSLVAYTMLFLVGIFRAGGDVKFSIYIEIIPLWFVSLPLMYVFTEIYTVPVIILFLISYTDEFIKLIPCLTRYFSKKWINKMI